MNNLPNKLEQLKGVYNQKIGQLQALQSRVALYKIQIEKLVDKESNFAKASLFLQSLSDQTRLQVLDKISGIVTDALQVVKDKNLEFKMTLVTKNNTPTLDMTILDKQSMQTYDILNSMGGGVADIVALTLRIALLCRWQPSLSRVLILDEVGKFVSVKDQELLAEFVRKLSESLNLQLIWISHSPILTSQAHKVFEITKEGNKSKVEEKQ